MRFIRVLLLIAFMPLATFSTRLENFSIIVSTCDRYSELWDPFFTLLFKYWPSLEKENAHVPIILYTNGKDYHHPRVTVVKTPLDRTWSGNMEDALKAIPTKYVLYLQDDYFLNQPVNDKRLAYLLDQMDKHGVAYLETTVEGIYADLPEIPGIPGVAKKEKTSKFRVSSQAAIWEKTALDVILMPNENPWEFETNGTERSRGMREPFWTLLSDAPVHFLNESVQGAAAQGYIVANVPAFLEKEGIPVDFKVLPLETDHQFAKWWKIKTGRMKRAWDWIYKRL